MIKDIWARGLSLISTEITPYSVLINRVGAEATKIMIEEAEYMGANAIIHIQFQNNVHMDPLMWSASVKQPFFFFFYTSLLNVILITTMKVLF